MFINPTPIDHQAVWPLNLATLTGPLTALQEALDDGRLDREVLNRPDDRGMTLLFQIAPRRRGVKAVVHTLLAAGADPCRTDAQGQTSMHHAVHHDNPTLLLALVHAGADLNAPDSDGDTPLHLACLYGRYRLMAQLLRAGADALRTSKDGSRPLDLMTHQGGSIHEDARVRMAHAQVTQETALLRAQLPPSTLTDGPHRPLRARL